MIDSVFRSGKNYCPQVFLEECKLEVKEQKMPVHITDDMEIFSNDSDRKDSDEEISNEEDSNEENYV